MKTTALAAATIRGTTWISTDGLKELGRRDRLWLLPLVGLGILVGVGMAEYMLINVYRTLLAGGTAIGHPELVVFYGVLGSWAFLFLTGIPVVLSVLYYSSDLKILLTLPVRPLQIVAAKGVLLYAYSLPVNVALLLPALWLYAGTAGLTAAVFATGVVQLLLTPLLPLSLSILFVIGLMKIVNLSRFRVALEVAGMAVAIVGLIGFQVLLSRTTMATAMGSTTGAGLGGFTDIWSRLTAALPPFAWAAEGAVAGNGPLPILLDLALTAAVCAVALALAPLNFLYDVMERRGVARGRRRRAAVAVRESASRGVRRQLVSREWAILASNSTFIFEAVGEILVLPLLLVIYGLILPRELLATVMQYIAGMPVLSIGLMGVLVLMTSLTTVSATSISREGPRLGLSLTVPVAGRVQVQAKLVFHLLFFTTAYLVDLVIVGVLFRFPLVSLLYMVPGGIAMQVVSFCAGMFFDLKRPFLTWTHPQQAMKNNANAMSGIGTSAGLTVLVVLPLALLVLKGFPPLLGGVISAAAAVLLAVILLPRLLAFADRQYSGGLEVGN